METLNEKKKFKLAFPETSLLLLIIIVIVAGLTYIMPAGQFDRVIDEETGRELVQSGTYKVVESNPTSVVLQCFGDWLKPVTLLL